MNSNSHMRGNVPAVDSIVLKIVDRRQSAIVRSARRALFGIAVLLSGTATAQEALRIVGDTNPVTIHVLVRATDGTPIGGLTSGAFQITEDGASQAINTFASITDVPVTTIFVMDYSSSMSTAGAIGPMEDAVEGFIDLMQPSDEAAVIKFAGNIGAVVMQGLTSNKSALKTAVNTNPGGISGTNLYDAIDKALDVLSQSTNSNGTRAVVVLTDGSDTASSISLDTLSSELDAANVPVFTIGLGNDIDTVLLESLADATSAAYAAPSNPSEFTEIYSDISERLNNEYRLTYYSALSDCNAHQLRVLVTTDEGPKDYNASFARCFSATPIQTSPPPDESVSGAMGLRELSWLGAIMLLTGIARRARKR